MAIVQVWGGADWTEAGYIAAHWNAERKQFGEELRRWQSFRNVQQWRREHRPEFAREEETERQRYPQDPLLTASLKKLKDWKEYQAYFQRGIDRDKKEIERARGAVEAIQRKDPEVVMNKGKIRGRDDRDWLNYITTKREWVAAEEKRMEWVKQQLPVVLSECAASLIGAPTSRREMKERSEFEARRVFQALVDTGGRPTRPIRPVSDIQEREHTDDDLHVLCHWESECSQFEEELREWKKILDYRQKKEADGGTKAQLEEQQSAETMTQVDFWKVHRAYRQREVDNAEQWVEFWQRQVEDYQEVANDCLRDWAREEGKRGEGAREEGARILWTGTAARYHSMAEDARSYVEQMRKEVGPAESRLEWVSDQLLLALLAVSTTEVSTSNHQAKLPKGASRSGQTTLKDLRSRASDKSAPRSNRDKKKKHVSANSALGPIHSSRVPKAPRRRRRSNILTEHGEGQNRSPNTTISPPSPANVAPRRSSRLSKRSGALEASLAVDLGRSVPPPPTNIILRRSDRISNQKQRMSTSTSNAAVNSSVVSPTDPFPRRSRSKPKGCLAGNKSDMGSAKPRGISKRQGRHPSRNRTKIHG